MLKIKEELKTVKRTSSKILRLSSELSTAALNPKTWLTPVKVACFATLSLVVATTAVQAGTISINAASNPNNVIQLDGQLSATITHTAEGIAIEIPGVVITLDCGEADVSAQTCTVAVGGAGSAAGYGSGATNTAGGSTGASTGGGTGGSTTGTTGASTGGTSGGAGTTGTDTTGSSASTGGTDGALNLNELCGSPRPDEYNSRQISWDKYCPGYTPTDTSGSTGGNSDGTVNGGSSGSTGDGGATSGGGTGSNNGSTDCPGPGYDCYNHGGSGDSGSDSGYVSQAVPFPDAGSREIEDISARVDFGSAGSYASGSTVYVPIAKGGVVVAGMTMSSEKEPTSGRISFGPTANQPEGGDLRLWVSKEPDGERISEACSYVGYAESALRFDMDGAQGCSLERGGPYYLNMALCNADYDDWDCRSVGALTAEGDATLVFEAKYD